MNNIPKKLGRYQVIRELGRGAMGVVYKAYDPVIEREVAIKAILLAFQVTGEEKKIYLDRFFREAKAAGKLNHPNIVTIYDVDEDKETGTPFIVMEFLEGTTLQEIVASGILLPLEDTCNIITQIADALNYAHQQGVVHRDVKVGNILILHGMKAKIMDFGIARMASSDLTRSGQFIGTPNYMSPEQVDGKHPVDGRSDLFSLGVIFYLLLTGERPFAGDSFTAISYKIVHVEPAPPKILNPAVPEVYNKVLGKILAKDPTKRYQTGAELITDIRKLEGTAFEEDVEELEEGTTIGESTYPTIAPNASASTQTTVTEFHEASIRRLALITLLTILAAGVLFGGVYYFKTSTKTQQASFPSDPTKEVSRQNQIRIKWDLAMNYYQNGMLDQCEDQLNEILKIDPEYEEAEKFVKLVEEKKKQLADQKAAAQAVQQQPAQAPPPQRTTSQKEMPAVVPVQASPEIAHPAVTPPQATAPAKVIGIETQFELDHSLPSGTLYVYADDRLIHTEDFQGTKKKFLMITHYNGKLTGSFKIPEGASKLKLRVVCKELSISTSVEIRPKANSSLKIIYNAKQLEAHWS